ncbi:MAG: hypothetical protein AAF989_11545, partial [Planctomycetota bacterium]
QIDDVPGISVPTYRGTGAGNRFEQHCLDRLVNEGKAGKGQFNRYGVQVRITGEDPLTGQPILQSVKSFPDIEGLLATGTQAIFDCKVCSDTSLDLSRYRIGDEKSGSKEKQLRHMVEKADYGAVCGFVVHWNDRKTKSKAEPSETFWFPVHRQIPFWIQFWRLEIKRLNRDHCRELGVPVRWNKLTSRSRASPDLYEVMNNLDQRSQPKRAPRMLGSWQ